MNNLNSLIEASARSWSFDDDNIHLIPPNALCIVRSTGFDERSDLDIWRSLERIAPERLVRLADFGQYSCKSLSNHISSDLRYRSDTSIRATLHKEVPICIDITSLPMVVWAPLVRIAFQDERELWIVYTEPKEYRFHKDPMNTDLFDLNERVGDVVSLPGMVNLAGPDPGLTNLLCIFLGFEGGRARHITTSIDPEPTVIPIVGSPGMNAEYAIQAIECNREYLKNTNSYKRIKWVDSICPFSAYQTLLEIYKEYPDNYMYLAPVGTKPHALGMLLYSLHFDNFSEIIFDQPIAKQHGTEGIGKIHLYRVN